MPACTATTKDTKTTPFTVKFCSRSARRKVFALSNNNNTTVAGGCPPPEAHPQYALTSKQQLVASQYSSERLNRANVEDYEAARRLDKDEVHYLKAVVYAGLHYQKQQGKFEHFAARILGHSQRAVKASTPGTCTTVTASQAHSINFVAKTLCKDVESLVPKLGYTKTLNALHELHIWRC